MTLTFECDLDSVNMWTQNAKYLDRVTYTHNTRPSAVPGPQKQSANT